MIEQIINDKTDDICSLIESVVTCCKSYVDQGIEQADTQEVGQVTDIIKDLSEAYSNIVKGIYHSEITKAMENSTYGTDYDVTGVITPKVETMVGKTESEQVAMIKEYLDEVCNDIDEMIDGKSADTINMVKMKLMNIANGI